MWMSFPNTWLVSDTGRAIQKTSSVTDGVAVAGSVCTRYILISACVCQAPGCPGTHVYQDPRTNLDIHMYLSGHRAIPGTHMYLWGSKTIVGWREGED